MADNPNGGRRKRAIVLIPGMMREERDFRRQVLTDNLAAVVQDRRLEVGQTVDIEGETGQRLQVLALRGDAEETDDWPARIDVFEAHWSDLVPDSSGAGPWAKLWNGFDLLRYWLLSPGTWRAFRISPVMSAGLAFGGVLLVLWYVSLVLIVADALPDTVPQDTLKGIPIVQKTLDSFLKLVEGVGFWQPWLVAATLLSVIKVDRLVTIARFTKDYLENRVIESEEDKRRVGLKDRLRERVVVTLERVLSAGYDEVLVVAHSFGTVIAVDALREWPHSADLARLRLVTLGSPLAVLRYRSDWLASEVRGLLTEGRLTRWTDFYATSDWLCAAVPEHARVFQDHSHRLEFEASFPQRLFGQTHLLYFRDQRVLTDLAAGD